MASQQTLSLPATLYPSANRIRSPKGVIYVAKLTSRSNTLTHTTQSCTSNGVHSRSGRPLALRNHRQIRSRWPRSHHRFTLEIPAHKHRRTRPNRSNRRTRTGLVPPVCCNLSPSDTWTNHRNCDPHSRLGRPKPQTPRNRRPRTSRAPHGRHRTTSSPLTNYAFNHQSLRSTRTNPVAHHRWFQLASLVRADHRPMDRTSTLQPTQNR